jgi:hypothetical protein
MKITKDLGLYRQIEEYDYIPTPEELLYYYKGTHAGFTRDNPYRVSRTFMTTRRLIKLEEATDSPKPVKGNERTTDFPQAGSEPEGKPNE